MLCTPLRSAEKQTSKVNLPFGLWSFSIVSGPLLDISPYANSSDLSYTSTLSYTMNTLLPGLIYALGDHSGGFYAPHSIWLEISGGVEKLEAVGQI